jgi:hypothetical protein
LPALDLTGPFCTRRFERNYLGKELVMPKRRFSAEQIVPLLRQIEGSMGQGNSTQIACQDAIIPEALAADTLFWASLAPIQIKTSMSYSRSSERED